MEELVSRYCRKVQEANQYIDARGVMQMKTIVNLPLDEVYVSLTTSLARERLDRNELVAPEEDRPLNEMEMRFLERGGRDFREEKGLAMDDLWRRGSNWVILGDPGSGKTTILRHIAYSQAKTFCTDSGMFPIIITLRYLAHEWRSHPEWSPKKAIMNYLSGPFLEEMDFNIGERNSLSTFFHDQLEKGNVVLLCDGLDEQRDGGMKAQTVEAIGNLLEAFPRNRCLVTSRIVGYNEAPLKADFQSVTLEPFTPEQRKTFFNNWFYAVERREDIVDDELTKKRAIEKADELIRQIEGIPGVQSLATNPLLCTVIALIYQQGAALPSSRVELYKLCVDTFIFNWEMQKRKKGLEQDSLDKDGTQAVLEEIALHLHEDTEDNRMGRDGIIEIVRKFLIEKKGMHEAGARRSAEEFLTLIRDVAGLLINKGNEEFGFFHLTFQEYLAARAITRKKKEINGYLGKYLFNPRWREVFALAAAHQGQKDEEAGSEFIEAVRSHRHQREDLMHYAFRLAFRFMTGARVELDTSDKMVREWIKLYLSQPELQEKLLRLIEFLQVPQSSNLAAYTALITSLKDGRENVQRAAVKALGKFRKTEAIDVLLLSLKDSSVAVRVDAVTALGNFREPRVLDVFLMVLNDEDKDSFVRVAVASELRNFREQKALNTLLAILKDQKENSFVRSAAIKALEKFREPEVLDLLLTKLTDKDIFVQMSAANALGNFREPKVFSDLLAASRDKNKFVRNAAVEALRNFREPKVLDTLLNALKDDDYFLVRHAAAVALGNFREPEVLAALLAALKDENEYARAGAAMALKNFQETKALAGLLIALKDENEYVRVAAAMALVNFREPSTLDALLIAIKDKKSDVREAAAGALKNFREAKVLEALLEALNDNSASVRKAAARSLGNFRVPRVMEGLLAALKDKAADVGWAAADALERIDMGSPI